MEKYLEASKYINYDDPEVASKAKELSCADINATIKACFEFVRDEIKHSSDYKLNPVTVKASDVLKHKTGYCYAKSHLLAALLRANNIPTGLCYQRLTLGDDGTGGRFCLHGLNAVYIEEFGWYRIDPRGNKDNVHASFCPPKEDIAYPIRFKGEKDLPEIWHEPLHIVTSVLESSNDYSEVANNLPDIYVI